MVRIVDGGLKWMQRTVYLSKDDSEAVNPSIPRFPEEPCLNLSGTTGVTRFQLTYTSHIVNLSRYTEQGTYLLQDAG